MAEKNNNKYSCKQKNCPVKTTGICLEAFTNITECPHIILLDSEKTSDENVDTKSLAADLEQAIFSGDVIFEDKLHLLTNKYHAKLILLLGDSEAGKTTLLASIFDKFQKGPCGEFNYGGSRTQIGFEKRCFLARWTGNGRTVPDTERTKSLTMHYLHLAIKNQKKIHKMEHLIFTDVSGEQFKILRDSENEALNFKVLKRADCIFYVVNGDQLINLDTRQKAKSNTIKLIQRLIECEMLTGGNPLEIVITKYDQIQDQITSVNSFFISDLKSRFPDHIKGFMYVASRSTIDSVGAGTGIEEFLGKALQDNPQPSDSKGPITTSREFQKFQIRI